MRRMRTKTINPRTRERAVALPTNPARNLHAATLLLFRRGLWENTSETGEGARRLPLDSSIRTRRTHVGSKGVSSCPGRARTISRDLETAKIREYVAERCSWVPASQ